MQNKTLLNILQNQKNSLNMVSTASFIELPLAETQEMKEVKAKLSDKSLSKTEKKEQERRMAELRIANVRKVSPPSSIANYIPEFIIAQHKDPGILKNQVQSVDEYIRHPKVYAAVANAYESKQYKSFSPESGDNNCQSRVFLLEILSQNVKFDDLQPEEKLVLSICYIMNKYKTTDFDPFMMEKREQDYNQSITINGISLGKFATHTARIYDGASLISHALAEISIKYMCKVDEIYNHGRLQDDLSSFTRKRKSGFDFASQQMQLPTMLTMYTCLYNMKMPLVYKVIQIKNEGEKYSFSGADLIVKIPDQEGFRVVTEAEKIELQDKAVYISECVSMINEETSRCNDPFLTPLAQAANFAQYIEAFSSDGYAEQLACIKLAAFDFERLAEMNSSFHSEIANEYLAWCQTIDPSVMRLLSENYAEDSETRNSSGILSNAYHCYPSTIRNECVRLASIDRSVVLDKCFKNDPVTLSL